MTKTKLYAKKTLSVFMAVMMLMTAWVFVAPEKAEAIASNVRGKPAIGGSHYAGTTSVYGSDLFNGELDRWFKFHNEGSDYVLIYYPSHIYLDKSETLQSAGYFFNVDWHFGHSTDYRILIGANALGDNSAYSGYPTNYYTMTDAFNNYGFDASLPSGAPSGVYNRTGSSTDFDLRIVGYDHSDQGSDGFSYQNVRHDKYVLFRSNSSNDPNTATIYLLGTPKGTYNGTYSTSGNSFASYGFQQNYSSGWKTNSNTMFHQKGYGNGDTSSSSYNPGGWPEMEWGVTIYDKSSLKTEIDTSKTYTNDDGKYTASSWNDFQTALANAENVLKKREVTQDQINEARNKLNLARNPGLTYQDFTITWKYQNGDTAGTYTRQWGTHINCAELSANYPNTIAQIAGNDTEHQTYKWETVNETSLKQSFTINEISSDKAEHNYGDYTQGETNHTRTCSTCGYVHTQAHIKKDTGYVTKEETCTEDGVMTYDCAVCGKVGVFTETIDKIIGHVFTGEIVENVTGENGNHWRKCLNCDAYGWSGVENQCESHKWGEPEVEASTCEKEGHETYTCTVCKATFVKDLPFADHKTVATEARDVTKICGSEGNKAFWTCTVCKKIFLDADCTEELTDYTDADNDKIPDTLETKGPEHVFEGAYVSKTSGKDGTHYRECNLFDYCKTYGPEEKHDWGEPVVTSATCTATGKEVYTCKLCPQTYEVELEKAAHNMTKIDAVAPKCGKAGNNEYYYCSTCGKFYKDEAGTTETTEAAETLAALEHKWTAHHEYDTLNTPATCMAAAVYNNHCDYCEVKLPGVTHLYGDPDTENGHKFDGAIKNNADGTHSYKCTVAGCDEYGAATTCDFKNVKTKVKSTCKTRGYTIYECTTCKAEKRVDETDLDFTNHEGETEIRAAVEAKCNADGYTGNTYCLGCGTMIEKGETIKADPEVHPHANMKPYDAKESTCQDAGYSAYKYCDQCGTYETEKVPGTLKAHKFTKYVTNNDGTHTAICDTCDATVAKPATDTKDCTGGTANCVDLAVCSTCGGTYGEVDSSNHKTVKLAERVEPTCQTEGKVAYQYCDACGENIDDPTPIEKKPHVFGEWTKIDGEDKHTRSCTTCKADVGEGIETETADCNGGTAYCNALAQCKDCKASYGELDKDNHKTQANYLDGAYDATCQKEGFTGDYLYECCNAVKQAGETIPKKDHVFDIEVENSRVDATCIAEGEVTYKCSTCVETADVKAATDKKVIPVNANNHATPNETVTVGKKAATCEEDGHTGDVYYKCCYDEEASASENRKALKEKGTTIKANGQHVYGDAIPEYMIERIDETKDADGNVTSRTIVLKTEAPDYDAMVEARRDDDKWYHFEQCTICGVITETACYTYEHTYNCVDTDKCEVCKGLCSLKDADKHIELIKIEKVEATHTTDGTKAYYQCKGCKKYFLDDAGKKGFDPATEEGKALITISKDTVPCTGWEEEPFETVAPTCGNDGYKKYHCIVKGCTKVKTEVIPATSDSHEWGTEYVEIKAPTCGSVGYEALYCTKCDAIKPNSTVTIAATGEHVYKLVDTQEGTSCKDPTKEFYKCEGCGKEKTETVYDGAAEHDWTDWVTTGGDCASGIIQERECKECGEKERKTESTDAHSFELVLRVEPTVEKDGYEIYKCTNCELEERKELPYEGETPEVPEDKHVVNEDKYTVVKPADCEHGEIRRYICLSCGETVEKEIGEPAEHVWLLQKAEMATCTADGHREYYRCVRCLGVYEDGKGEIKIEKLGHDDKNSDGKCDRCNAAFYGEGECGCICHKENGFMQLIYKILRFFWKLFKIGRSCDCGAVHY